MDRASFTARVVTVGPLDDADAHVGWTSDEAGAGPHLILMRSRGDDSYCIVSGDSDTYATCFGGISSADVQAGRTTLVLESEAATALGLPEQVAIEHGTAVVDARSVRQHVALVLSGRGRYPRL